MSRHDGEGRNPWGIAALASAGIAVVGAGVWALERGVVKRLRRREDSDAGARFELDEDERAIARSSDGAELATYCRGASGAPTVLFIHGWTLTSQVWCKQFEGLPQRGIRVVAYDQRGHGASTAGHEGFTMGTLALDLRSVLEALDLRDVIVVGHSMGGLAIQAFCAEYPDVVAERVRSVVLLSTLARTMLGEPLRGFIEQMAARAPDMTWVMGRPDVGFLLARAGFGRDPRPSNVEFTRRLINDCSPSTRRDAGRMLLDIDVTAQLTDIRVPALVVVGSADVLTPPRGARIIDEGLPNSRLEVIEGGGHMLMLERSDELEEFLVQCALNDVARAQGVHTGGRDL